ncbi:winged helix-turn-helix domain-containing protein [Nonomuraea sp. NBC_00507]|uniref:ArsR/SmtB family transcription factor n=1 Tax=Nonomuraea sp. NBC_00507 TaxID=2976002 RepID=UPI002E196016
MLSTLRPFLRQELDKLAAWRGRRHGPGGWPTGARTPSRELRHGLYAYFEAAVRPHWSNIQGMVDADRAMRGRAYLDGGVEAMLESFRPAMRWESPVLTVVDHRRDHLLGVPKDPSGDPGTPVGRLLGSTRAGILRATVNGATTGELARLHEISASAASQHAQVLREAGLIVSRRMGPNVIHTATPLGRALLMGGSQVHQRFGGRRPRS